MDLKQKEAIRAQRYREAPKPHAAGERVIERVQTVQRVITEPTGEINVLKARIAELESQVQSLTAALADAAADRANLMNICKALDDRISSFGVKVEKAA